MSGEKVLSVSVLENARLLEAARQAAIARHVQISRDIESRFQSLSNVCNELGDTWILGQLPPRVTVSHSASITDARNAVDAASTLLALIESELSRLSALRNVFQIVASTVLSEDRAQPVLPEWRSEQGHRLKRIVERVPFELAGDAKGTFESLLVDYRAATSELSADRRLLALDMFVQRLCKDAKKRARDSAEVQSFIDQLSPFCETTSLVYCLAADQLKSRLVEHAGELKADEVREEVAEILNVAKSAADRSYALSVLRESLERMGYEIGEDFSTFDQSSRVLATRSDLPGYAVEFTNAPPAGIRSELVRLEPGGTEMLRSEVDRTAKDRKADGVWCGDYLEAIDYADSAGVRVRVTAAPMSGRVRVVRSEETTETAPRRKQNPAPKMMSKRISDQE